MKIPDCEDSIENLIDKAHEENIERPRPHMGASMLGGVCERKMWLSFRWAVQPKFPGRILRLFLRGQWRSQSSWETFAAWAFRCATLLNRAA